MNQNAMPTLPSPFAPTADRIFCRGADGALKVHPASVTCDVCRKAAAVTQSAAQRAA